MGCDLWLCSDGSEAVLSVPHLNLSFPLESNQRLCWEIFSLLLFKKGIFLASHLSLPCFCQQEGGLHMAGREERATGDKMIKDRQNPHNPRAQRAVSTQDNKQSVLLFPRFKCNVISNKAEGHRQILQRGWLGVSLIRGSGILSMTRIPRISDESLAASLQEALGQVPTSSPTAGTFICCW